MRPGKLCLQVVVELLLGCMLLTLRAVAIATGMMDAVVFATALALREAVAVMSAAAVLDGADGLVVRGGQVRRALKILWRKGGEDIPDGSHDWNPCMSASMRW